MVAASPIVDTSASAVFADRVRQLAERAAAAAVDVVLIAPGADLQYFAGHSVASHERLTVLAVPVTGEPQLLVPALERAGWSGSPLERMGVAVTTWTDGTDPYQSLIGLLPAAARVLAVDYHMPAVHALGISRAVPGSELTLAGEIIAELRMRKSAEEVSALVDVGAAIDRVHRRIGEWLRPGRTEAQVAADIAAALVEEGHTTADFVIVGSGSNGPSTAGYFSDCTRTYRMAGASDPDFDTVYEIVRRAQQAGIDAVAPGVPAEAVDAASRSVIEAAGYGEYFITRTGHGIGLEVHEHPYIVSGNALPLEPGMAFSIEPGIYLPGRFGVRIEDIVVVGDDGAILVNKTPKTLVTIGG